MNTKEGLSVTLAPSGTAYRNNYYDPYGRYARATPASDTLSWVILGIVMLVVLITVVSMLKKKSEGISFSQQLKDAQLQGAQQRYRPREPPRAQGLTIVL